MRSSSAGSLEIVSGIAFMSQSLSKPTPADPWYITSISQLLLIWYWSPPDQLMMYGMRKFGS